MFHLHDPHEETAVGSFTHIIGARVAHDAHDLPDRAISRDVAAERVAVRKVEPGHGLVDHGDPGSGFVVTRFDTPPAQQVRADGVEISGSHVVVLDGRIAVYTRGEPFDLDVGCRFGAAEDAVFGDAHRGDAWNRG